MRQTLHIFRKDLRFLWPPILMVLLLTAIFGWSRSIEPSPFAAGNLHSNSVLDLVAFFLVLSWWYLVTAAIHKEQPAGDRQFWLTRPYAWKSLAGAKLLLIVTFINLPFLLSDIAILSAHGLAPSVMSLLARQLAIAAIFLLPVAALAALTKYSAQMALTIIVIFILFAFAKGNDTGAAHSWGVLERMRDSMLAAILSVSTLGVLLLQYAQRRTPAALGVLTATAALCLAALAAPPLGAAIALAWHGSEPKEVRAVHLAAQTQDITDWLGIQVEGTAGGIEAEPDLLDLRIEAPNGESWHSGWRAVKYGNGAPDEVGWSWSCRTSETGKHSWLAVHIGERLVQRFQSRPVTVGVSLAATIYRTEATVTLAPDRRPRWIAGAGTCSLDSADGFRSPLLLCRAAEYPSARVQFNGDRIFGNHPILRAVFEANPVWQHSVQLHDLGPAAPPDNSPIRLTTQRAIAYIRRDLAISGVQLRQTVARP